MGYTRNIILLLLLPSVIRFGGAPRAETLYAFRSMDHFDESPLIEIRNQRPDFIFIGNSMLYSRIDFPYLDQISGRKNFSLAAGGSKPGEWFLSLKNYALASEFKPKRIFFFFRDRELTETHYKVEGFVSRRISEKKKGSEPEFAALTETKGLHFELAKLIPAIYPIVNLHLDFEHAVQRLALSVALDDSSSPELFLRELNSRFSVDKMRHLSPNNNLNVESSKYSATDTGETFSTVVENSFLPKLIDLAKTAGVPVTFIRVKRRPDQTNYTATSPETTKYLSELSVWLNKNGANYFDFTDDPKILLTMYGEGDHLGKDHMQWYTSKFFEHLREDLR